MTTTTTAEGAQKDWERMSATQQQEAFDALPAAQKKGTTSYYEWIKAGYAQQYENWMPWIEDQYLRWFTRDNKASYTAKGACFPFCPVSSFSCVRACVQCACCPRSATD